jgi:hypothetical protein
MKTAAKPPRSHVFWIAIMLATVFGAPAFAQDDSRVDVSAGYSSMRDYDGNATFPRGWFASAGADVAGPLAMIGDVSGSYKSMGGLNVHVGVRIHTFMGGPRVQWRGRRVAPYAQMLFGVARTSTTFRLPEETLSDARHNFALAPGGGIDVRLSSRAAARVGTSLRLIRSEMGTPTGSEPFTFRELQLIAGVVVR